MDRLALFSLLTLLTAVVLVVWRRRQNVLPYPPGPRPKWIIGNIMDMPSSSPWLRFSEWGAQYGEITYLNLFGRHTVILNSLEACRELLEQRGANTGGRPFRVMLDLMGLGKPIQGMTQHQDTARWRYQRRLAYSAFGPQAVKNYHPIHELHVAQFVKRVLDPAADCVAEVRLAIGKIMFAVTYGLPVEDYFDEFLRINEIVGEAFFRTTVPGRYLVESFPILRYVPKWFPGADFKRYAAYISELAERQANLYYDEVKHRVATGTAPPSFVSNSLSAQASGDVKSPLASRQENEDTLAWAASTMYRAATTTTEQTIFKFLTAMQLHPEIQRKAQQELERVVGTGRLPTIEDRGSLPYVNAVIMESLRWHASLTIGIPHRTIKDDSYKGYFLPKNTNIIFNAWNLSRHAEDDSPLDNPDEFIPERFLSEKVTRPIDPQEYTFGFGRRICPGRHIANDIIFLMISGILSTLWISKPVDEHGNEIPLRVEWTGKDSVSYPEPVKPTFKPRSPLALSAMDRARNSDLEKMGNRNVAGV
ncbi:O-methylsterigmatocystin oxidoreductase [Auricularia subglabra TFB-10046 SS5]|nr:O-methylsterigmatocystin oxidoreductase [Auricularia subglabra TFB-10046 SS5]